MTQQLPKRDHYREECSIPTPGKVATKLYALDYVDAVLWVGQQTSVSASDGVYVERGLGNGLSLTVVYGKRAQRLRVRTVKPHEVIDQLNSMWNLVTILDDAARPFAKVAALSEQAEPDPRSEKSRRIFLEPPNTPSMQDLAAGSGEESASWEMQ